MKTLLLLRHAKSSWSTNDPDMERPLAERGLKDAVTMSSPLRRYDIDVALVSVAKRTRETWQQVESAGVEAAELRFLPELYGAWPEQVVDLLHTLDDGVATALVLGHEPTMSDLVADLAKPSHLRDAALGHFPTAALAVLTFDGPWKSLADRAAEIVAFETPRRVY